MEPKPPKTYEEQVAILRSRGCFISDDADAIAFLKRVNYYRFSGYILPFKQVDDSYMAGTSFDKVASIYTFDQALRGILIRAVGEVEITAKSIIAYYHAHRFGALGYLNPDNFSKIHNHEKFIEQFENAVRNNRNALFVRHHLKTYAGNFPIWVATELFTMGMISLFYADLPVEDKRKIAKEYDTDYIYLETWLHNSSVLRNLCAHYWRLYNNRFHQSPKLPREYTKYANMNESTLFKQLYMLKLLYANYRDDWNNAILSSLFALVLQHDEHLDLKTMGFPVNWEDALRWKQAKK